jgi:hypothetical protein
VILSRRADLARNRGGTMATARKTKSKAKKPAKKKPRAKR